MKFARRYIGKTNADFVIPAANRTKIIINPIIENIVFDNRTGRYDSYDISFNEFFGQRRVFKLLAYRNLVAVRHKFCYIIIGRMKRNSAHRRSFALTAILTGQNEVKHL